MTLDDDAQEELPLPPAVLTADDEHWKNWSGPAWRIHKQQKGRPDWNQLRHFGPASGQRFDPQELPEEDGKPEGVQYVASSMLAAIGEVFQTNRTIPLHDSTRLAVAWEPIRPLRLLDVRTTFGNANKASAVFSSARKDVTRAWARLAHLQWPDMDGIIYSAKKTGLPCAALFTHAEVAPVWPTLPSFSRSLTDPAIRDELLEIAETLRWEVDYGV
ncbi:RES family NAD+ phosphorylase [Curtobacterium flaccumfaciens]|uniref:RES family NAD+ phosphorylase n=1 Tax=Curtobacterium poinsettiae TaxID=159612 RepID=A0A9Q9P8Z0_9MICO|nr:RES family NAD+ phosphorylase [Curtobacterium flaccumfaciens]UXN26553.1 RES family NAD+ phosphorylase [Curtobacterium flaccumfaciens]UYC81395.1 RES family NAD+ phosphorylase [Curtobacterium flaccumfaciens pv. poinsettiae]